MREGALLHRLAFLMLECWVLALRKGRGQFVAGWQRDPLPGFGGTSGVRPWLPGTWWILVFPLHLVVGLSRFQTIKHAGIPLKRSTASSASRRPTRAAMPAQRRHPSRRNLTGTPAGLERTPIAVLVRWSR